MDELLYLEGRGQIPPLGTEGYTTKDIATMAHERSRLQRIVRAQHIYRTEILRHAPSQHRAAIAACSALIIEAIAGCLPLEEGATV